MHATAVSLPLFIPSQTPHCIRPIMLVLRWCVPWTFQSGLMLPHWPAVLNQDHCFRCSLARSHCVSWYLVHQTCTETHTQTGKEHTHKAHSSLERWAEVVTVITDPHLTIQNPRAASLPRLRQSFKLRCGFITHVGCVSVHSYPANDIPRKDGTTQRGRHWTQHTHFEASSLSSELLISPLE